MTRDDLRNRLMNYLGSGDRAVTDTIATAFARCIPSKHAARQEALCIFANMAVMASSSIPTPGTCGVVFGDIYGSDKEPEPQMDIVCFSSNGFHAVRLLGGINADGEPYICEERGDR